MDTTKHVSYIPPPMASFLKVFFALTLYAAVHSLLLRPEARLLFEAVLGKRAFRGLFRLAYNTLAIVLFGVFLGYAAGLSDVGIVEIYGLGAWILLAVRLVGVALIVWALKTHGFRAWLGLDNLRAWKRGEDPRSDGVDASSLVLSGPYRWVRHPMYAGALLFLWAVPGWSVNRLSFALAASLYLWLGAAFEEGRLCRVHGKAYENYASETPGFVPRIVQRRRSRS